MIDRPFSMGYQKLSRICPEIFNGSQIASHKTILEKRGDLGNGRVYFPDKSL